MKMFVQKFVCTTLIALVLSVAFFPSAAQAQLTAGSQFQSAQTSLPACGLGPVGDDNGTVEGCAVRLFYYVLLYPSAWLASLGGQVFDYFVAYTLDSDSYRAGGFVEQGWRIVRDLANISFIFIMLYIAITFIVGAQNQAARKLIARVILIALVINFSLFMTRAVIDAGNILGRVFYERISVNNDDNAGQVGYTTISQGLLSYVNPQQLLSQEMFGVAHQPDPTSNQNISEALGTFQNASNNNTTNNELVTADGSQYQVSTGFVILIIIIAAAINIYMAYVFFSVGIYFIGRTIGLWFMMIMSPLAFASISIPGIGRKMKRIGFDDWFNQTLKLSFLVVVFMFFLYLTIMFLGTIFDTPFTAEGSTVQKFMAVVVPFVSVFFLLGQAKKQAKELSGEFGSAVGKALKYAVMGTVGAAGIAVAGLAAAGGVAGRQVVGRRAAKMAAGADTTTARGRFVKKYGNKLANSSFDARNIKIPKPAKKALGGLRSGLSYATDGNVSAGEFAVKAGQGSKKNYAQLKEDRINKKVEEAKNYSANEHTKVSDLQGSYVEEEVDKKTGKIKKTVVAIDPATTVSVDEAKSGVAKAKQELNDKKAEIHKTEKYEEKKVELERREKDLEKKQKEYNELLNKKKAGDTSITQRQIDIAEINRNSAQTLVKNQKQTIKKIENEYLAEANNVAKAEGVLDAAKRSLHKKNAEVYNNYADSIEKWSNLGAGTHRVDADKSASGRVRSMADKEEEKS